MSRVAANRVAGRRRPATRAALSGVLVGLLLPLTSCAGDPQQEYCDAVRAHQEELTGIISGGGQDALIRALAIFRDLRSKAPSDISDEWQQVVTRVQALDRALRAAGVDPASYDRAKPPPGLSAAERADIDAAARELGSKSTLDALAGLDQEARDVCRTPLSV